MEIKIIFEDRYMIVAEKPRNVPSQNDKSGDTDMLTLVKNYLKRKYKSSYAVLVHRLDRGVGGLMAFSLDETITKTLVSQINDHNKFRKHYIAVVCGTPDKKQDTLENFIIKNERQNITKVVDKNFHNSKIAMLSYSVLKEIQTTTYGPLATVDVTLFTGRHHQIRVQLANIGLPIWGDTKYNENFCKSGVYYKAALDEDVEIFPALWANKLMFRHPKNNRLMCFESKPDYYPFNTMII